MKTKLSLLALFVLFTSFAFGQDVSKQTVVEPFQTILLNGHAKVELVQSTQNALEFNTAEKPKSISYSVKNGVLKIDADPSESDKVIVYFTSIASIKASDLSQINIKESISFTDLNIELNDVSKFKGILKANNLKIETNDAAEMEISGSCTNLDLTCNDASKVDAPFLVSSIAKLDINDAAHAYIQATDAINAKVSDASKLFYVSNANNINIEVNDVARVKQIADPNTVVNNDSLPVEIIDSIGNIITDILVQIDSTTKNIGNQNADDWHKKMKKSKKDKFNGNWGGIMLGFNNYLTADNQIDVPLGYEFLDPKFTASKVFSINLIEQNINLIKNKFGIVTGLGIQWNNYFLANNAFLSGDSNVVTGGFDVANKDNYSKSKLTTTFINVPLIFEYQTNPKHNSKSFHINAGAVFGVRIGSHTKIVVENPSKQKIKNSDDFHLNPIRLDLTAGIGYGIINLVGTYSLTTLFKEQKGPQLYPVSVGIYLALW